MATAAATPTTTTGLLCSAADEPLPLTLTAEEAAAYERFLGLIVAQDGAGCPPEGVGANVGGSQRLDALLFLASRKFDVDQAMRRRDRFYGFARAHNVHEVAEELVQQALDPRLMRVCGTDSEGSPIFSLTYREFDASFWSRNKRVAGVLAAMTFSVETLLLRTGSNAALRKGVVFVMDAEHIGWSNFSLELEKVFTSWMQDVVPMRIKAIYIVNPPFLIRAMLALISPFLSSKMKQRMKITKRQALEKVIDPKQLEPTHDLGAERAAHLQQQQ